MPNNYQKANAPLFDPEMIKMFSEIQLIAGYKLDKEDEAPFIRFHKFLTDPEPKFISEWRENPKLENWYHKLTNGILKDVQNTFAGVKYHYERVKTIEINIKSIIEKYDCEKIFGNNRSIAGGNTLKVDFEYQGFILAFRRCLDLLARAISAYFKNDFHSFRTFTTKFLNKFPDNKVAISLIKIHQKYSKSFDFVMSNGNRKSTRDKITHYEFIPAWVLNVNKNGITLAGGGEDMEPFRSISDPIFLSEILKEHLDNLKSCISEMIESLVKNVE